MSLVVPYTDLSSGQNSVTETYQKNKQIEEEKKIRNTLKIARNLLHTNLIHCEKTPIDFLTITNEILKIINLEAFDTHNALFFRDRLVDYIQNSRTNCRKFSIKELHDIIRVFQNKIVNAECNYDKQPQVTRNLIAHFESNLKDLPANIFVNEFTKKILLLLNSQKDAESAFSAISIPTDIMSIIAMHCHALIIPAAQTLVDVSLPEGKFF